MELLHNEHFKSLLTLSPQSKLDTARDIIVDLFDKPEGNAHELTVLIDAILGIHTDEISERMRLQDLKQIEAVYGNAKILTELPTCVMYTPYWTLHQICKVMNPQQGQTFVDLGSGFGRLGFYLAMMYPGVMFVGYEIVRERFQEALRVSQSLRLGKTISFQNADLDAVADAIESADHYFLFDAVSVDTLAKVVARLKRISERKPFKLAAIGLTCYQVLVKTPWLRESYNHPSGDFAIFNAGS